MSDDLCWTSLIGAPTHNLGDLPEKCFTCAAKRREDETASRHRVMLMLDNLKRQDVAARESNARGVDVLTRLMSGMSRPLGVGEFHVPLPSTTEERRAQGFTYAERDSKPKVGQD